MLRSADPTFEETTGIHLSIVSRTRPETAIFRLNAPDLLRGQLLWRAFPRINLRGLAAMNTSRAFFERDLIRPEAMQGARQRGVDYAHPNPDDPLV
jgi:hypothetical protein